MVFCAEGAQHLLVGLKLRQLNLTLYQSVFLLAEGETVLFDSRKF